MRSSRVAPRRASRGASFSARAIAETRDERGKGRRADVFRAREAQPCEALAVIQRSPAVIARRSPVRRPDAAARYCRDAREDHQRENRMSAAHSVSP